MTDQALVEKKLAFLERCLRELRELVRPEEVRRDLRAQRFVEHTLQLAIQAALDVASHIVSDEKLGEPRTNRALFELLARNDWVSQELLPSLTRMAGFRNILVHGYTAVDLDVVVEVLVDRLGDLDEFVRQIRGRLG